MTDPRPPSDATDEPLDDHEELVLDLVDHVVELDDVDTRDDAATLADAVDDHELVRSRLAVPVEVPDLVRERALRATLATPIDALARSDTPVPASTAVREVRHRSSTRRRAWLVPVLGAAAACVLLAGVAGVLFRAGNTSTTASMSASQAAVANSAPSQASAPAGVSTNSNAKLATGSLLDFGSVNDEARLIATVRDRIAVDTAPLSASPPTAPANPSSVGDESYNAASAVPCEPAARALQAQYATAPVVVAGSVRYQDQPAVAIVFAPSTPDQGRYLVALTTTGCQVLADTAF